jgi:hypothetical protein
MPASSPFLPHILVSNHAPGVDTTVQSFRRDTVTEKLIKSPSHVSEATPGDGGNLFGGGENLTRDSEVSVGLAFVVHDGE